MSANRSHAALGGSRTRGFLRAALIAISVAYPLFLLAVSLLFRFVGEHWWVTGVGSFLPRVLFAAPIPVLSAALLAFRLHRLLVTQMLAALLALFPLMGFVMPLPHHASRAGASMRVLSCNVDSGYLGIQGMVAEIVRKTPDIVFLQELFPSAGEAVELLKPHFMDVQVSTQFLVASRFPIQQIIAPDRIGFESITRSPRYMRYLLETPLGTLAMYNVHPISPRSAFATLRGKGLRWEILSGRIFAGAAAPGMRNLSELKERQIRRVSEALAREKQPVIVVGDLNLPGLSPVLHRYLGTLQDGFSEAGWGFGYTFPVKARTPAWMRLDRILATDELRFTRFDVLRTTFSDHECVYADIERADRQPEGSADRHAP